MQALDHAQAQASLAIEHLGHPAARPDEGLEVARRQALLLHTVFFTKKVDDIDFRLLHKAFDEIASRLPVKLVVKKEAAEYFETRRAERYEKLKVEANDAMVKPEKWDYGIAANQVNSSAEIKLAALSCSKWSSL